VGFITGCQKNSSNGFVYDTSEVDLSYLTTYTYEYEGDRKISETEMTYALMYIGY
jgi:hypothetical protein